jgi:hypothetical protein
MTSWEQHAERASSGQRSLLALAVLAALTSTVIGLLLARINPLFGFGGLLVAAVALGILSNPERATLVVFFVLYSNITVVAIRSGLSSQLAGSFFLLLGLPLFHLLIVRRERIIVTPVMILMIGYLAALLLSAAASERPSLTFARIQNYLLEGLVLYFLVVNVVRQPEMLRRSLWVILLAGALMGGVTLYQGVTRTYDNDFGGFAQITQAEASVGEEDFLGNKPVVRRFAGPIGEKNRYAQTLVVLLPLAGALALSERRRALRLAAGALALLILGGTLYTFSRGAGLAIVVMVPAAVGLHMVRPRSAIVAGVLATILIFTLAPGYVYRLSTLGNVSNLLSGDPSEADTSVQGRATENLATLRIFLDHPLLGVGPGQTPRFIRDYGRGIGFKLLDPNRRAHNLYLEELADTGMVGFALFGSIVALAMARLARVRRRTYGRDRTTFVLASGLLLSILTYLVTAVFLHLSYARYYWFLLALAGAAIQIGERGRAGQPETIAAAPER